MGVSILIMAVTFCLGVWFIWMYVTTSNHVHSKAVVYLNGQGLLAITSPLVDSGAVSYYEELHQRRGTYVSTIDIFLPEDQHYHD